MNANKTYKPLLANLEELLPPPRRWYDPMIDVHTFLVSSSIGAAITLLAIYPWTPDNPKPTINEVETNRAIYQAAWDRDYVERNEHTRRISELAYRNYLQAKAHSHEPRTPQQ